MSRKGENIYKRKDGRWEGRYKKGVAANGRSCFSNLHTLFYKLFSNQNHPLNGWFAQTLEGGLLACPLQPRHGGNTAQFRCAVLP